MVDLYKVHRCLWCSDFLFKAENHDFWEEQPICQCGHKAGLHVVGHPHVCGFRSWTWGDLGREIGTRDICLSCSGYLPNVPISDVKSQLNAILGQ